jgi:hypothetical protein
MYLPIIEASPNKKNKVDNASFPSPFSRSMLAETLVVEMVMLKRK